MVNWALFKFGPTYKWVGLPLVGLAGFYLARHPGRVAIDWMVNSEICHLARHCHMNSTVWTTKVGRPDALGHLFLPTFSKPIIVPPPRLY